MTTAAYDKLHARFEKIALIGEAQAMLSWDASAMMPSGGAPARGEQMACLSVMSHELATSAEVAEMIDGASAEPLDAWQAANLSEIKRGFERETAIPSDLIEAQAKAESACEMAWRSAREDDDWEAIKAPLAEILTLAQRKAEILSEVTGLSKYDALLDGFDPGGRSAAIDVLFDDYAAFLQDFLDDVLTRQASEPEPKLPDGPFDPEVQRQLGVTLIKALGFDFDHGRLDISTHPFCGGTPTDVRITTRYDEDDFTTALMGVLHETGHALYERGLPSDWRRQPVGHARGMQMHESQSLLMEMQACRSDAFLGYLAGQARAAFGGEGDLWSDENIARIYRKVERGFIRVDADEITYPAHVILRYRLEQKLLSGDLTLDDLPGAWSDELHGLLGIRPPSNKLGVLQDIHWYMGAIGYFPTYSLGAMTAAQLFAAARKALPDMDARLGSGDFSELLGWLRANVHGVASSKSTSEIITAATGEALNIDYFKNHLRARYLP